MMEHWLERWREGRIGWHEAAGNGSLQRYWKATDCRVLVPLCGKSYDMLWLESQGNEVLGVELSELAVRAFFEDNGIDYRTVQGGLTRYEAIDRHITIVCGDYFEFGGETFDACYDRGALVAMPPEMRARYARHTSSLLLPDAYQLLIVLEYDQLQAAGPPFAVRADQVLSYWPELNRIAPYDDIENCPPKFRDAGLTEIIEVVWRTE